MASTAREKGSPEAEAAWLKYVESCTFRPEPAAERAFFVAWEIARQAHTDEPVSIPVHEYELLASVLSEVGDPDEETKYSRADAVLNDWLPMHDARVRAALDPTPLSSGSEDKK